MSTVSRLGRGLGSLIPSKTAADSQSEGPSGSVQRIPVSRLRVNPRQPRAAIEHGGLEELIASIREHGILQPLIVMPSKSGGYELIAGERRYQAAKILGLKTVPVVVREATEQQQLELALVENVQRKDLNPLEEATAYEQLVNEFNLTQESLAKRVGKSRSHVANTLRLLSLPDEVKKAILNGKITEGHAKVILSVETPSEQLALFERMVKQGLSVRAGEAIARAHHGSHRPRAPVADPEMRSNEEAMQRHLGTKVRIERHGQHGTITITFYSFEELKGLIEHLTH
ncbi:MAG: ParB/RepB/Spo0J family partition protein [bacterium]